MDLSKLDPDFFIRHAAYTRGTHRDVYPAIDPRSPNLSQSGKVVIITGASSGIGATGLAPAFAQADARVIALVGRRSEKLAEVATKLRQDYPAVEIMEAPLSITDADAVEALLASIISKFSTIDVLINNAGVLSRHSEILATNVESWWNGFETNVLGTYLVTRSFLKALGKEKHGTIINVSSGAAAVVQPGASSYSVSKVAIERLSEFVAAEYPNVTSVALEPGTVDTDMILVSSYRLHTFRVGESLTS